jgi:hypothetical protein
MLELDLTPAHIKGLSLHVVFMLIPMLHDHHREAHGNILKKVASIVEYGGLKPVLTEWASHSLLRLKCFGRVVTPRRCARRLW